MPPERTTTEADDDRAHRLAAELRAVPGTDAASEARFWRARAEKLGARLRASHERLRALAERLPARYARLLDRRADELPEEPDWPDPLEGWNETTSLEEAHVASELPRLWARLGRPAPR